jgi:transglutaminase-like putative cysteine protease
MEFMNVKLPEEIVREEYLGNFKRTERIIDRWLKRKLPDDLKMRLTFEKERIQILLKNYLFTEKEAIDKAKDLIEGFKEEEFYKLFEEGCIDYIVVEGEKRYEKRFLQNIGYALPEYKKRLKSDKNTEKSKKLLENRLQQLLNGAKPKEYKIRAKISVKIEGEVEEDKMKVWLPFPKEEFQQRDARVIATNHKGYFLTPSDVHQRTVYFEGPKEGEYFVEFEYIIKEWINSIDPAKVSKLEQKEFLKEDPPHIVFTPYLKRLAREIVGEEENPYLKAKKIYDWITLNVNYSYVLPYAIYENIPEFIASNLKGDCGFQALLFITLCRIVGVPVRWQSGWNINPYSVSPHDWALLFVSSYGWIPVDPSFGEHYKMNEELRRFYFGNLDAFRMVANTDFMKDFVPEKIYWRSDPCDNQVGEIETENRNIYDFQYEIKVVEFKEI